MDPALGGGGGGGGGGGETINKEIKMMMIMNQLLFDTKIMTGLCHRQPIAKQMLSSRFHSCEVQHSF